MHALIASSQVLRVLFKHESLEKATLSWSPQGDYSDKSVGLFLDLCLYPEDSRAGGKSLKQLAKELDVASISDMLRFYDAQPLVTLCRDILEEVVVQGRDDSTQAGGESTARNIAEVDNLSEGGFKWSNTTLSTLFGILYPKTTEVIDDSPYYTLNREEVGADNPWKGYNRKVFELLSKNSSRILLAVHDWKSADVR